VKSTANFYVVLKGTASGRATTGQGSGARAPEAFLEHKLHTELWTSWASLLRSYAAAHGLNTTHHAVVEVGPEEITLRVNSNWLLFRHSTMQYSDGRKCAFALTEHGTVLTAAGQDKQEEEMDIAAERLAREMMQ
jgi:hypothetical protein